MTTIVDTLQEIIRHELRSVRLVEVGVVKAVFPHTSADDVDNYGCDVLLRSTGLELKRVPVATGHVGTASIPNVGDLVVVAFGQGDVNQPIIIGRLYNDEDRPPINKSDELIFRLPLAGADDKTIKGAVRNPAQGSPAREIIFELPPKITVRITEANVRATAGKTELVIDQPDGGGGTVTVVSGRTKIVLNQDGDVTVEAAQGMSLKANADLTLEGVNVKIKATGQLTAESQGSALLKAMGTATVRSSGATTVQGALVSIKGLTSFTP